MDDDVERLRAKLVASDMRCAVLTEQVRVLQRERDTFAQQLRHLMTIVDRLDRRFAEVLKEMAELKAERAAEVQTEVAGLVGQVPPEPPPNEAPKPPDGSTSRSGSGKKGRDKHGRNTKGGFPAPAQRVRPRSSPKVDFSIPHPGCGGQPGADDARRARRAARGHRPGWLPAPAALGAPEAP